MSQSGPDATPGDAQVAGGQLGWHSSILFPSKGMPHWEKPPFGFVGAFDYRMRSFITECVLLL